MDLVFELLGKQHDRMAFSCGKESLDRYLHASALRDQSSGIARVFVLAHGPSPGCNNLYTSEHTI